MQKIKNQFMNDTMECPECGGEMHFDIVDETGAHYECSNCDYEWCDTSTKIEGENDDENET